MDQKFKKSFLKGTASASIGTISSMAFHFFSITILARVLPVSDFGFYSLLISIVFIFNTFSSFGLEVTLVKFLSMNDTDVTNKIFFPILIIKLITTTVMAIAFYFLQSLILPLFGSGLTNYGVKIILLFFMGSFRDVFFNLFQGLKYFKKYASVQIFAAAIRVIFILIYVYLGVLNLENLIFIEIFTNGLAIIFQLLQIPYKKVFSLIIDKKIVKSIIDFSLPVYANNIFDILNARLSLFIIGLFLSPATVAYYDVGSKLPQALRRVYASFLTVFYPNLASLFSEGDKISAEELINKSLNLISLLLSSLALVSFLFRNEIIILLFSKAYAESSFVFFLLMLNFLIRALSSVLGNSNLSAGYPSVPMRVNIISSIISLLCSIGLIPIIGFSGAAYAVIMSDSISQILYFYFLKKIDVKIYYNIYLRPILILFLCLLLYSIIPFENIFIKIIFIIGFMQFNLWYTPYAKNLIVYSYKMLLKLRK